MNQLRETLSASFEDLYQNAEKLSLGREGFTTVMAVTLTGVHILELAEQSKAHSPHPHNLPRIDFFE